MKNLNHTNNNLPAIVLVIPAYMAETDILSVLSAIPKFVQEIIVVNDCNPNQTAELVRNQNDPRVHLVSHKTNQGIAGVEQESANRTFRVRFKAH